MLVVRAAATLKPLARAVHSHSAPVVSYGPPGRSAVSGHVATVFGCTGFLGRYLVSKLAKAGTLVIVPYRDAEEARHLRPMGDLGQIVPVEWDLHNPETISEAIRHSDVVYNLVGREYETKNYSFKDVQITAAENIANACAKEGVSRLIHVSHLNANPSSPSHFYATKAKGEEAVRDLFPGSTIVRPGPMYGHEDKFLNSMAVYPVLWTLNHARTLTRPVHVLDVAQALSNLTLTSHPAHPLLNLPGPTVHSYASLLNLVSSVTYNPTRYAPTVPKSVMMGLSKAAQAVWWPLLSPDEVERRFIDDVGTAPKPTGRKRAGDVEAKGEDWTGDWGLVGVHPDEVENLAITYLRRYRNAANFSRPVVLPGQRGDTSFHELQ